MLEKLNIYKGRRSGREQSAYLLRVFSISSIISIAVIILFVGFGVHKIYNSHIISGAQREAASIGANLIEQEKRILIYKDKNGVSSLRLADKDFFVLDFRMKKYLKPLDILKIKVFSKGKEIIYSTDSSIIGKIDNKNAELDQSLNGNIISKLEDKETISDIEGEERMNVDVVEVYYPIEDENNDIIGSFEIYVDVTRNKAEIRKVTLSSVLVISIVLLCVFSILFIIMRAASKTIEELTGKETELAARAAAKAVAAEVERKRAQELEKAYEKLRQTRDMLIQSEKLKAIGQLASGVAHEVRNPLAVIMQGADYLKNKFSKSDADAAEVIDMVRASVKRADKIIASLLDFSRSKKLDLQSEDVKSILETALILVEHSFKFENVEIIKEISEKRGKVLVDKNKMEQVFVNLFLNSLQAMPQGGKLILRVKDTELENVGRGVGSRKEDIFEVGENIVRIEIEDTGCGISQEDLNKIFDPFFTTKGLSKGTGLGLSVTRNIISMHRGMIDIESNFKEGTKIIITLRAVK